MMAFVVDTNVPIVANRRADHADPRCVLACVDALDLVRAGVVVVDDGRRILHEYLKKLSPTGQPGAGDAFVKWLLSVQADPQHCERVAITPRAEEPDDFEEFPRDPALRRFDRDGRKFVAVALASRHHPPILKAVDSDWHDYATTLARHGVEVSFLCPHLLGAPE